MNHLKLVLIVIAATLGGVCLAQDAAVKDSSANAQQVKVKLPRLLELGSTKCVSCKMMVPVLEKMKKEYAGLMDVEFIDVWIKENAEVAKKFEIEGIPTQIFFDAEGKELSRHAGYIAEEYILKKWKELGYDFEKLKNEKAADKK